MAGHLFFAVFQMKTNIYTFVMNHVLREYSTGLTDKELELVQRWIKREHDQAEIYRVFAHRLCGTSNTPGGKPRRGGPRR